MEDGILVILLTCLATVYPFPVCLDPDVERPIAFKDGDYIIGGLFNVGNMRTRQIVNQDGKITEQKYCDHTKKATPYEIQKGLLMRWVVGLENERFFKEFNRTLGYVIYDTCENLQTAQLVASKAATLPKVVGISSVDNKKYLVETVGITTSAYIPSFIYMYNDQELLVERRFPTLYSIIDTEIVEAKITINFLKEMGYTFMDIWYHPYSEEMARYIYKEYVLKVGCGRIEEIAKASVIKKQVDSLYEKTQGEPAQVQLVLSNNAKTTLRQMEYWINDLGWRNKIYIFGMSNGRRFYHERYIDIVTNINGTSKETLVFPISSILNAKLENINNYLLSAWTETHGDGRMDEIYREIQGNYSSCTRLDKNTGKTYTKCGRTSWSPYVVAGIKTLTQSMFEILKEKGMDNFDCEEEFRQKIHDRIVQEDRMVTIQLDEDLSLNVTFADKSISSGFIFEVYRSWENNVTSVAVIDDNKINVTDRDILDSLPYNKTCSHTCYPGTVRAFQFVKTLPCCWLCETCLAEDHYSDDINADHCHHCHKIERASRDNHTKCEHVPIIYIEAGSFYFVAAAGFVAAGLLLTAGMAGFVFYHRGRPVIKASEPTFLYVFLFALLIGFMTGITPLFKPSRMSCDVEYHSFVLFASLATSNLAWRCGKIYSVFQAANHFDRPKFSILLSIPGQIFLNLLVIIVSMGLAALNITQGYGRWTVDEYQPENHTPMYLKCNFVGKKFHRGIIIIPLLVPLALFFFTLILAFKMRRFPHNFRESSNICMATLVVLVTCVMFLSGYKHSPPAIVPMLRAIVYYITSLAFLVCLFLPKVIVLVKRVDNQKEKAAILENVRKFSEKSANRRTSRLVD